MVRNLSKQNSETEESKDEESPLLPMEPFTFNKAFALFANDEDE